MSNCLQVCLLCYVSLSEPEILLSHSVQVYLDCIGMESEYVAMRWQWRPRAGMSTRAVNHSHRQELDIKVHGIDPELALVSCNTID